MKNNYMKNLIKRDDSLWMLMAFEVISCLHIPPREILYFPCSTTSVAAADGAAKWNYFNIFLIKCKKNFLFLTFPH